MLGETAESPPQSAETAHAAMPIGLAVKVRQARPLCHVEVSRNYVESL